MREIAPFGLRLTPKLKTRLEEEAAQHGRSLQKEVVKRLEESVNVLSTPLYAGQPPTAYIESGLTEVEKEMLRVFRSWSVEKQLGFLTLFK